MKLYSANELINILKNDKKHEQQYKLLLDWATIFGDCSENLSKPMFKIVVK